MILKYRAIDEQGRISEPFTITATFTSVVIGYEDGYFLSIDEATKILPYTGVNDKFGNEIYQGDIIQVHNVTRVVEWSERLAGFAFDNETGYRFCKPNEHSFERIGNINETI